MVHIKTGTFKKKVLAKFIFDVTNNDSHDKYNFLHRSDRELCALLGKRGQAPVSVEQGISLSQQIGCVMYVETTSRFNRQSVLSAFEIAALAALGQITTKVRYLLK